MQTNTHIHTFHVVLQCFHCLLVQPCSNRAIKELHPKGLSCDWKVSRTLEIQGRQSVLRHGNLAEWNASGTCTVKTLWQYYHRALVLHWKFTSNHSFHQKLTLWLGVNLPDSFVATTFSYQRKVSYFSICHVAFKAPRIGLTHLHWSYITCLCL